MQLKWVMRYLFSVVLCCVSFNVFADTVRFAFGVNGEDFSLSRYRIDDKGRLRHLGHIPVDKAPSSVVLDPSGQFVATVSSTTDRLMVFRLDSGTGKLTEVPGSPFKTGTNSPFSIRFHPSGHFVYLGTRFSGVGAFSFDQETGMVKPVSGSPFPAQRRTRELVIHPSGRFLYASNGYSNSVSAYRIDEKTGGLEQLPDSPYLVGDFADIDYLSITMFDVPSEAGGLPHAIDIDPQGKFVFVPNKAAASTSVFRVNQSTGRLVPVPGSPFFTGFNPYRSRVHPNGHFIFTTLWADGKLAVHAIDQDNGRLTPVRGSPFSLYSETPVDIAFNADGSQVYVSNYDGNDISLLDVNAETGFLTFRENFRTRLGPWSLQVVEGKESIVIPETEMFAVSVKSGIGRFFVNQKGLESKTKESVGGNASGIAVSPDGRFVYTIDKGKDLLATFSINPVTGEMKSVIDGIVKTGKSPSDITIDVNGWYLYVTNADSHSMSVYYLDPQSGIPKEVRGSPIRTGKGPVSVTIDSGIRYLFVVNNQSEDISVYRYLNAVTPLIFEAKKYGSPFKAGKEPVAISVDPTGRFAYVANAGSNTVSAFNIHHKTGALSAIHGSPFQSGQRPIALAVHPDGLFLYIANEISKDVSMFRIEASSGALKPISRSVKLGVQPKALWMDATGDRLFVLATDGLTLLNYQVERRTGSLSLVDQTRDTPVINDIWIMNR